MLYLFDLDDTLVRTEDLSVHRQAGVNDTTQAYKAKLIELLNSRSDRLIWTLADVKEFMEVAPADDGKKTFGIFSRAPRSYIETILDHVYPGIKWDIIVAYEDVIPKFKPHGRGIALAKEKTGERAVMMIGDDASDIKAAYHAIAYTAWNQDKKNNKFDFESWNLLPDFIYETPEELINIMRDPIAHMMPLEAPRNTGKLFVPPVENGRTVSLFCPDNAVHRVRVLGKHFSRYAPIKAIRQHHELSSEIEESKSSETFPDEWATALSDICRDQVKYFGRQRPDGRVVLTCIPARPGRVHRLSFLLNQCEALHRSRYGADRVVFVANVFGFVNGVRSNSNDYLSRAERFENVSKHLLLRADFSPQDTIIVVDDVVTSGASLIGSKKLLELFGVKHIQLVGISKNIGDIMPEKWKNEAVYAVQ
jgi:HAD superfamily hydrolase (TIGR01549 family)